MPRASRGGAYPLDWKDIAKACKDAAGWRCVRCGHEHDRVTGHVLTVHHLDMNPANCEWWNLAALCQKCHLSVQARVVMERVWLMPHTDWFKPYVAGYYAFHNGLPHDRDSVLARVDELIALGQGQVPA
jgi:5-methylcytosine-specific restriction endonuclease McrA